MEGTNLIETTEEFSINPKYFIQLAIQKEMPWNTLVFMLTDLITNLDRSKQVIRVLVEELERWVLNVKNDSNHDVTDSHEKQADVQIQNNKVDLNEQDYEENFECSDDPDSDIESIDTDKPNYQPKVDESRSNIQTELMQNVCSKTAFDFPANEYYEFIANEDPPNSESSDPDEAELLKDEPSLNDESQVKHMTYEDLEENGFEVQNEFLKHEQNKVDFSADEGYNFISNNEKPSLVSFSNDETILNSDGNIKEKNQCKFCEKCFSTRHGKARHERIHTVEKPFQCQTCKKSFNDKGNLEKHERIHTGEKPFKCKFCQKQCRDKHDLIRHERIHTGEKPFQCQTCKKSFSDLGNLKKHEMSHTGEKPFQCKTCKQGFYRAGHLKRHERRHTQEKPFKCKSCNTSYSRLDTLKRHQNIHN